MLVVNAREDYRGFADGVVLGLGFAAAGCIRFSVTNLVAAGIFCAINKRAVDFAYKNLGGNPGGATKWGTLVASQLLVGTIAYGLGLVAVKAGLVAAATLNPVTVAVVIGIGTVVTLARYSNYHFGQAGIVVV